MKKLVASITLFFISAIAFAQAEDNGVAFIRWASFVGLVLGVITTVINLHIVNRLLKTKEEILSILRKEFKDEIEDLESKVASKQQVEFMRKEMELMLKGIEFKIERQYNKP